MKKICILFILGTFAFLSNVNAQDYKSSIGLRLGYPMSFSLKQFISESNALEASVNYRSDREFGSAGWTSIGAALAYQVHQPIDLGEIEGLSWYYGFGGSAYFWSYGSNRSFDNYSTTSFGVQGYVGLDYAFADTPINLSIDWVPSFLIGGYVTGFGYDSGAFSIRYIFAR